MHSKIITLLTIAVAALFFTGCKSNTAQMAPSETNILGIVKVEEASYAASSPTTVAVSTNELFSRQDISGDKVTLFWGLITLKDY